jgi:hypothetical protein
MGSSLVTDERHHGVLRSRWGAVTGWAADRPVQVTLTLTSLIAAHAVLATAFVPAMNPYKSIKIDSNTGTAVTLYLGLAAAAAIVAGFAGVIMVFTIGSEIRRVRSFRFTAGKALQRSWMTAIVEPFLATFLGIIAAVTQMTSGKVIAPWLFELGVALLTHGSARLLWLLHELIEIVYADDHVTESKAEEVSADLLFPKKTGS